MRPYTGIRERIKLSMVKPELRTPLCRMPVLPVGNAAVRRLVRASFSLMPTASLKEVTLDLVGPPGPQLRIYKPTNRRRDGALYWIHGGGFVIGKASQDDRLCAEMARKLGVVIVSVDYRLAPEHHFPAPLDDCVAGWRWLQQHARTLGVDPKRIAVGGESAGGGLAASLVQLLYDAQEGGAAAQLLFYPMLDDRTAARRELDMIGHRVWDNRSNAAGWRAFLAVEPGAGEIPNYASASRRKDLKGLAPAWIGVGDLDLFYSEDCSYAEQLSAAGADVTLVRIPDAPHGFVSWAFETKTARTFRADARAWLESYL